MTIVVAVLAVLLIVVASLWWLAVKQSNNVLNFFLLLLLDETNYLKQRNAIQGLIPSVNANDPLELWGKIILVSGQSAKNIGPEMKAAVAALLWKIKMEAK